MACSLQSPNKKKLATGASPRDIAYNFYSKLPDEMLEVKELPVIHHSFERPKCKKKAKPTVGFAFSWGPLCWIACSEMFPYRTRGKATIVTTMSHWLFTTIGTVFPVASTASLSGCFGFFAISIFLGTLVVYFFQVETAGKTSHEIDQPMLTTSQALSARIGRVG